MVGRHSFNTCDLDNPTRSKILFRLSKYVHKAATFPLVIGSSMLHKIQLPKANLYPICW